MKDRLRRCVWVIDLFGMLVGAGLLGHLVANQIVTLWPRWTPSEYAPSPARRALAVTAPRGRFDDRALFRAPVAVGQVGVHHCELSRPFVAQLFDRLGRLPHRTLIVPETVADHPVGVRVFGDLDGFVGAIGLSSGDLLLEANGFPLTNPSAILRAYAAFKQSNEAWLVIERRGRRILLTYTMVDAQRAQSRWSPRQAAANSSCVP